MATIRAVVRFGGRVQGVGFRYFTERSARGLGLVGWVRNRPDGDVEALFEGPEELVREAIETCRQGPPGARVETVEIDWQPAKGEFANFAVRY